jgi:hypothetical protein
MSLNDDPRNIVGIQSLLNINGDISKSELSELEKEIINGMSIEEEELDTKDFDKEMERINRQLEMNEEPQYIEKEIDRDHIDIGDVRLKSMTTEKRKQDYVDDILGDMEENKELEFDIDKEKEEDDKNSLLEQIDMLKMTLEDYGTDIGNIPNVNKNSSLTEIQNVYKILKLKNNRIHYCSFAEEAILAAAHGMEYLFDGEKEWFGRKIDLTGWHKTVQIKLRRCRFQTSTLVQEFMQEYNLSPATQLLLELVPSMILYSRRKKSISGYNDDKYNDAFSNLNSL